MAQKPALRHVLGQVRLQAGLSQSDLAKILGCAAVTVQKIEQGNLGLSEELAAKVEEELGVSAAWLLANDPTQPALTPRGGLWTVNHYEFAQGSRHVVTETKPGGTIADAVAYTRDDILPPLPPDLREIAANAFIDLTRAETDALVHAMLEETRNIPKQGILVHRLRKMLKALEEDFKPNEAVLKQHRQKIQKAREEYSAIRKQITDGQFHLFGF
jgi:transcriptional regulator with XRE-family HTH domain